MAQSGTPENAAALDAIDGLDATRAEGQDALDSAADDVGPVIERAFQAALDATEIGAANLRTAVESGDPAAVTDGDGRRPARGERDRHLHDRAWGLAIRVRRGGLTIGDRGVERIGAGLGECQCLGFGATIRHAGTDSHRDAVPDSGRRRQRRAPPRLQRQVRRRSHAESDAEPHAIADANAGADAEPHAIADS